MSSRSIQFSIAGLALSSILPALGTVGTPSRIRQDNIRKPVSVALAVAVAPLLSTSNKADQAQPKPHRSPIEASRLESQNSRPARVNRPRHQLDVLRRKSPKEVALIRAPNRLPGDRAKIPMSS